MLILAGVAINLTVGDNGLFRRAQNATDTWRMAEENEQSVMEQAADFIDNYITRVDGVPIPKGFYYVGGAKETGLVISDNPTDKDKYSSVNWADQVKYTSWKRNRCQWGNIRKSIRVGASRRFKYI